MFHDLSPPPAPGERLGSPPGRARSAPIAPSPLYAPRVPSHPPYPFDKLEHVPRASLASIRLARDFLDLNAASAINPVLSDLLGSTARVHTVRINASPLTRIRLSTVCLLRPRDDSLRVLILAEAQLAARIAAIASGRPCPLVDPLRPAPDPVQGAFAAVLLAACRRAFPLDPPVLVAAGPQALDLWRPSPRTVACEGILQLDDEALAFTALVDPLGRPTAARPFGRATLRSLGDIPLALRIDAGAAAFERTVLASLRPGDAFLPGPSLSVRQGSGGLEGDVTLCPPGATSGLPAKLIGDRRIVLGEGTMTVDAEQPAVAGADGADPAAQVLGEAPVLVRIEVGQVSMTAREWAAMGTGAVVSTGLRLAERVTLRIAGREVGRGELVDIDGELGVRIVELARGSDGGCK